MIASLVGNVVTLETVLLLALALLPVMFCEIIYNVNTDVIEIRTSKLTNDVVIPLDKTEASECL
jgi:hypothetical protein